MKGMRVRWSPLVKMAGALAALLIAIRLGPGLLAPPPPPPLDPDIGLPRVPVRTPPTRIAALAQARPLPERAPKRTVRRPDPDDAERRRPLPVPAPPAAPPPAPPTPAPAPEAVSPPPPPQPPDPGDGSEEFAPH